MIRRDAEWLGGILNDKEGHCSITKHKVSLILDKLCTCSYQSERELARVS